MATGRGFSGKRLPLTAAFAVLLVAAFGAGCQGFFTNPVLSSVAVQPPTAQILLGKTRTFQAWGTYDDGTRKQITSGVAWSTDDANIISIDSTSGLATAENVGNVTITASAEALSGTADATAYLVVSSLVVTPDTWNLNTTGGSQDFTVQANGSTDVTSGATFTPSNSAFSCPSGTSPVTCTAINPTAGSYTITVTYPGTTLAPTVKVTVSP